jgi:hypothetical protein
VLPKSLVPREIHTERIDNKAIAYQLRYVYPFSYASISCCPKEDGDENYDRINLPIAADERAR